MKMDGRPRLATLPTIKEALMLAAPDKGRAQRLRVITRHPERFADFRLSGWSVDVAWCSPRPGQGRLAYATHVVMDDVVQNTTRATAYILDVLDINGPSTDDVAQWLIQLDESSPHVDADLYVLLDDGVHGPHEQARWASISPRLGAQANAQANTVDVDATVQGPGDSTSVQESTEDDASEHGLRHLTRLPVGFSLDALRRRILQWRRMGFDVSDLEAALVQPENERERTYRHVEDSVRRAVDLDRRLSRSAQHLSAVELEHCRFRLRQLTGLDDIESKLEPNQA